MAKENSQSGPNLTAVYIAIALLGLWIVYLAVQHQRMLEQISQSNLCRIAKECSAPAAAPPLPTQISNPSNVVAPTRLSTSASSPGMHTYFSDCYNYQNEKGNLDGIASYIQNEISARGNLPFQYNSQTGCGGAGCPHDAQQCFAFWRQYASVQANATASPVPL